MSGDPGSAGSWLCCDALLRRTEGWCAFKPGDHLGAGAPPLRALTHVRVRPPDGSNGDPLLLTPGFPEAEEEEEEEAQLVELAKEGVKARRLRDE